MSGGAETVQALIDADEGGLFALDRDLRYTAFNRVHAEAMRELYGAEIALGGRFSDYQTVAEDRERDLACMTTALSGDWAVAIATSGDADRQRSWEIVYTPHADADGEIVGVLVRARDVSRSRQAESALRDAEAAVDEGEAQFQSILRASPDDITVADLEGRILLVSASAVSMLGCESEQDMLGRSMLDYLAPGDRERAQANVGLMFEGVFPGPEEYVAVRADGSRFPVEINGEFIRDAEGGPARMVFVVRDITERKRAQDEIRRLNAELEERVVLRTEQRDAATRELEAFAYSVSHDVRTPLRTIDGFSAAVMEDEAKRLSPDGVAALGRVRNAAQTLARLLDDLMGLSHVSRRELSRQFVDLTELAEEVGDETAADHASRTVILRVAPGLTAHADPGMVRLILRELLGNAWKFTEPVEHAHVEVGALDLRGERAFFVRDDGVGFDLSRSNRLFAPFQRMHPEDDFSGDGIGLATVQRLVMRHGGRVWAESEVGGGATFCFTLSEPDRQ